MIPPQPRMFLICAKRAGPCAGPCKHIRRVEAKLLEYYLSIKASKHTVLQYLSRLGNIFKALSPTEILNCGRAHPRTHKWCLFCIPPEPELAEACLSSVCLAGGKRGVTSNSRCDDHGQSLAAMSVRHTPGIKVQKVQVDVICRQFTFRGSTCARSNPASMACSHAQPAEPSHFCPS